MTPPQTTTELEQSCSISKKNMITKIFKVRKRREMLFVQVCFICSVLFVAWCMSVLLTKTGLPADVPGFKSALLNTDIGRCRYIKKRQISARYIGRPLVCT
ncbi:hypothetical protein DPX16_7069 [Anabarilius grahami]|uniref:Uncharacterized protein n=1 Tax=Anabarilius grahami TaxID=495550 RepID=A0A3N0Y1T7_ANAGA|nr:hypothetical protein DPX16_7069 [Anabarilius grahami]